MTFKKLVTLIVLSVITLIPASAAYAVSSPIVAKPVPAVALGCPYHFTISVQNGNLIFSGVAPDYFANSVKIDLIKPVNYATSTINLEGNAVIERDPNRDVNTYPYFQTVQPIVVRTLTYTLDPTNSNMAQHVQSSNGFTFDLTNAPKIYLTALSYGIYNLRTSYVGDSA